MTGDDPIAVQTLPDALARAAAQLAGCRFRLHGRDPATGLDCVGVVAEALRSIGKDVALPCRYALRGTPWPLVDAAAARGHLQPASGKTAAGDILLFAAGPAQFHLAVALAGYRMVHAHAGLRQVVVAPIPDDWPLLRRWRLSPIL